MGGRRNIDIDEREKKTNVCEHRQQMCDSVGRNIYLIHELP